ncbi:MAG: threonine/serine exporter family protein [Clostridiales bacterium]|nr:threonine/serine exporter family protein [Clostridiales bacterium]MDD7035043.1 threonine/serine exporter family protein [Bacillota bacterium]MDY2920368.1 threonine/serine exporter family protein [Lentihominibacter sp.]
MDKKRQKSILLLAMQAGKIMMKNGAEIYRVEDTITRICKACGIDYVNVFATPTGIFVSIDNEDEDDTVTYIKRIKSSETDLSKISRVNDFSRRFTTTDLSVEEGMKILDEIDGEKKYPFLVRVLGAALVASCFSTMFGGSAIDFLVAFIAGMICYTLSRFLEKFEINFFIRGFCCCALAAFLALLAQSSIDGAGYGTILTGCIMLFVPGVALTNSIRDFLSGDMVSGLARLVEAVLTGVALATGSGMVIKFWDMMGGFSL